MPIFDLSGKELKCYGGTNPRPKGVDSPFVRHLLNVQCIIRLNPKKILLSIPISDMKICPVVRIWSFSFFPV